MLRARDKNSLLQSKRESSIVSQFPFLRCLTPLVARPLAFFIRTTLFLLAPLTVLQSRLRARGHNPNGATALIHSTGIEPNRYDPTKTFHSFCIHVPRYFSHSFSASIALIPPRMTPNSHGYVSHGSIAACPFPHTARSA